MIKHKKYFKIALSSLVVTFIYLGFFSFLISPVEANNVFVFNKNLKPGMTYAPDISELQKFFNSHGFVVSQTGAGSIGYETNYFGSKTKATTLLFQKANDLDADSIVGPKTRKKLMG